MRTFLATLVFLLAACGGTAPPIYGDYVLDSERFAQSMHEQMEGQIDSATMNLLRQARMTLTLSADHTFTCSQAIASEHHDYIGTWTHLAGKVEILQTHEDGEEKEDSMTGEYVDGRLELWEEDQGVRVQLILDRK